MIKSRCPSVDILGINAYGSIENTPANIRKFNWDKPYIFSEWGVNGPFEAPRTAWGAKIEPPNGVKANMRQRRYADRICRFRALLRQLLLSVGAKARIHSNVAACL